MSMEDTFSETERREIAGRARTLHERLAGPPNEPGGDHPDVDRLLSEWRDEYPDESAFKERLDRDGLTEEEVRERVRATRWPVGEPLPDWIDDLESLLAHVRSVGASGSDRVTVPDDTPFKQVIEAVAEYAVVSLPEGSVPESALSPAIDWLAERLELLTVRALYVEFQSYLEPRAPELAEADPDEFNDPPTEHYDQFIEGMFGIGLPNLCTEYPVLARRVVGIVEQWTEHIAEIGRRIEQDRAALADNFDISGKVTSVEPLAEDTHARGRVPVRVGFESGSAIYKPRDVGGGALFYDALERLDDRLSTPSVRTPSYRCRDGYGWMETVEYADPADEPAVERYYERSGVILCLAYALEFVDCQVENVISSGEQPVVVDGETVFHPVVADERRPLPGDEVKPISRTVLSTALLPYWSGEQREQLYAAGFGSGGEEAPVSTLTRPSVRAVNTDVMAVGAYSPTIDRSKNTPTLDGEDCPPGEYVDTIESGFRAAYEEIDQLHADGRFFGDIVDIDGLEDIQRRLIYRPTRAYDSVRRDLSNWDALRDGIWATVELDRLAVPFFDGRVEEGFEGFETLYPAERSALLRSDIPRFGVTPDGDRPVHDGHTLSFAVDMPGPEWSRSRVDRFNQDDLARQSWILRACVTEPRSATAPPQAAPATVDEMKQAAVDLFDELVAEVGDPADSWTLLAIGEGGLNLKPLERSLYEGRCGTALAAAGLHVVTGQDRYRAFATDVLAPVVEEFENDPPSLSLGGVVGVGAVVYAFSVVADLLGEDHYRSLAREVALSITDDDIAEDDTLDVIDGSAGTLLALLAYHERFDDPAVLERAIACGDRLLAARESFRGYQVWSTSEAVPLTGFSHGTAGIAWALARLAAATGDTRYADAVREALAFEADLYDSGRRNWPVGLDDPEFPDRWCHGRAGIALARLGIADRLTSSILPTHPSEVLPATADGEPGPLDDLCCGNFGRMEALLVGADHGILDRRNARELAGRVLARRDRDGMLALGGRTLSMVNPSLFKGEAGAAYTLLRACDTDALPCVVLFE